MDRSARDSKNTGALQSMGETKGNIPMVFKGFFKGFLSFLKAFFEGKYGEIMGEQKGESSYGFS